MARGGAAELAERTEVAARTAAGELVQSVDAESAVEARVAQRATVVDVDVASTSRVAARTDAPETATLVHAPTYSDVGLYWYTAINE